MTSWTDPVVLGDGGTGITALAPDPFPTVDQLPLRRATGGVLSPAEAGAVDAGRAAGYQQGLAEGRAAGIDQAREDLAFALTALHAAIEDLHRRDVAGLATLADETAVLALAVAEAVVGREVAIATDPGRDAIARALSLAPDRGDAVARLHPDDVATLGDLAAVHGGRDIEIVADHRVERGGCLLDVGPARVDAQLGPAIERVRAELASAELVRDDHDLDDLLQHPAPIPGAQP